MSDKNNVLSCKDYLVSGEEFRLCKYKNYEILKTTPVPSNLLDYYNSEKYISHTDSKKTFTDKIYRLVKSFMLKQKMSWIEELKPKGKILDIGAGTGDFILQAKKQGWEIEGSEPGDMARNLAAKKGLCLKSSASEFLPETFDVISMWHVLEHVSNLEIQLKEIKRLLNEDGVVVVAVPNYQSDDANHYGKYWAAYDVPRHLWHFSQNGLKDLFNEHGFTHVGTKPLLFDSFYVSLLSEKHKNNSLNYVKAFWRGLVSNFKARSTSEFSSLVYFFKKG